MGRTTSTSALAVTSMHVRRWREFSSFLLMTKVYALMPSEGAPNPTAPQAPNSQPSPAQPTKIPPHTYACLLHCSNLGSHLYAHPTSSSASEHGGWTPMHLSSSIIPHLSSFTPCSQLCWHTLGQRCGSGLSRSQWGGWSIAVCSITFSSPHCQLRRSYLYVTG